MTLVTVESELQMLTAWCLYVTKSSATLLWWHGPVNSKHQDFLIVVLFHFTVSLHYFVFHLKQIQLIHYHCQYYCGIFALLYHFFSPILYQLEYQVKVLIIISSEYFCIPLLLNQLSILVPCYFYSRSCQLPYQVLDVIILPIIIFFFRLINFRAFDFIKPAFYTGPLLFLLQKVIVDKAEPQASSIYYYYHFLIWAQLGYRGYLLWVTGVCLSIGPIRGFLSFHYTNQMTAYFTIQCSA